MKRLTHFGLFKLDLGYFCGTHLVGRNRSTQFSLDDSAAGLFVLDSRPQPRIQMPGPILAATKKTQQLIIVARQINHKRYVSLVH